MGLFFNLGNALFGAGQPMTPGGTLGPKGYTPPTFGQRLMVGTLFDPHRDAIARAPSFFSDGPSDGFGSRFTRRLGVLGTMLEDNAPSSPQAEQHGYGAGYGDALSKMLMGYPAGY